MFDPRVWRDKPVPVPCRVSMERAWPTLHRGAALIGEVPPWLRECGVHVDDVMEAELLGWARLTTGLWVGRVRIQPRIGDVLGSMTLWATADAIELRPVEGGWRGAHLNTKTSTLRGPRGSE